jgi:hypothetical protein
MRFDNKLQVLQIAVKLEKSLYKDLSIKGYGFVINKTRT